MKTGIEEVIVEIEFALSLLEPPIFKVKPKKLSFEKGWFSGIWAEYRTIDVFIPHNELKRPYFLRSASEKLIKNQIAIEVYPLKIEINKKNRDPEKWKIPIFTMFSFNDRDIVIEGVENIKLIDSNTEEINIQEETVIEREDFKLKVISVEYHQNQGRPKSVVFRVTSQSKFPIIRQEQKERDLQKWEYLKEHSERKCSMSIRRFFYQKGGKNKMEIGETKVTLFPFFSRKEAEELLAEGYVGKLRIVYP